MSDRPQAAVPCEAVARAKVNLSLRVVGRRPDGYHDLVSIFARLDLADRLTAELSDVPAPDRATAHDDRGPDHVVSRGPDRLRVRVDAGYRPSAEDDLVLRALAALRRAHRPDAPGLDVRLDKRIPVAAGLAGGSADAAAALALGARAWGIDIDAAERLALAAELGSDVPFLAAAVDLAVVTGRGELVAPLPTSSDAIGVVLVTSGGGLSTADVFRAYDRGALPPDATPPGARDAAVGDAHGMAERLSGIRDDTNIVALADELRDANDLWPAACVLRPDLVGLRAALEARLERPVLLSGSGPTLLALYPSPTAAEGAAERLRDDPLEGVTAGDVRSAAIGRSETDERGRERR